MLAVGPLVPVSWRGPLGSGGSPPATPCRGGQVHQPAAERRLWTFHNLRRALLDASLTGTWTYGASRRGRKSRGGEAFDVKVPMIITEERHAALLVTLGATRERPLALLDEALPIATEIGMAAVRDRAERLRADLGRD